MKKIITILLFAFVAQMYAEDEDFFRRRKEAAHPTPSQSVIEQYNRRIFKIPYRTQEGSKFLNVLTTVDEATSEGLPTQNESSIAVNPSNPNIVIASAVDYRDNSSSWVYVSTDGGKTWTNKNLGKVNGWLSSNDPSVAYDKDGTAYMVHGAFPASASGENGVYIAVSTDGGINWSSHKPVIEHKAPDDSLVYFEDKYYIEVDNSDDSPYRGDLYIPWKRVTAKDSATQIVIAKSTDKGETWSEPVNISERLSGSSEDTTFGQSFPLVATGPDGEVYAVWNHGIEHAVGFNKSTDGGKTWGTPRLLHKYNIFGTTKKLAQGWRHTLKGKVRAEAYPVIQTDYSNGPNRGNVYVVWAADSVPNVYFSKSTDKGETWSEPKTVHSVKTNDQFWTWMSVDPTNGDIAVMYLDSRNDPDNILVECYVSYSSDGGETWVDRKISDAPSDIRNNPFTGNAFAGDYSGLDFYGGVMFPSWVDMRNAEHSIADNDVYSAIIRVDQPSPVENFTVKVVPDNPTELDLSWNTIWESTFGKKLDSNDFNLELYKNNQLIQTFSSTTQKYTDMGLTPFERYDYKIRAVSANDSSLFRTAYTYAGGTEKPDSVHIVDFEVMEDQGTHLQTRLYVQIPSVRADKVTPLTHVKRLELFADGKFIRIFPLLQEEIGKVVQVNITKELGNYANVNCVLVAGYENPNLGEQYSDTSNSVFIYEGELLTPGVSDTINFEDKNDGYYSTEWQVNDEFANSAPNSIATSPRGQYKSNSEYSFYLQPSLLGILASDGIATHELFFDNICMVNDKDSAVIEISNDLKHWKVLAKYSEKDFPQWQDDEVKAEDWIKKSLIVLDIGGNPYDYTITFLRFRLFTNGLLNRKGWYVDNIMLNSIVYSDVEDSEMADVSIYPNPTSSFLNVRNEQQLPLDIEIVDLNGNILYDITNFFGQTVDISKLNSGIYLVKLNYKNSSKVEKLTVIK